ncbi:MAG: hypothetical protein NC548_65980 [Lachnospiraceae bacterium]|nr:hypothetical protein [Lachnospiraceae bacterium]
MEETVSGNNIPAVMEPEEPVTNEAEEPSVDKPEDSGNTWEPIIGESVTDSYLYEADNAPLYSFLEELVTGTEKQNELLESILENLDAVKESLAAVPEESASGDTGDAAASETDEIENGRETLVEMLEGMEETFAKIKETGEGISETVSGNSLLLEDISGSMQDFTQSCTEASGARFYTDSYVLAFSAGILFIAACIAGLHIAKLVWEKMR